MVAEFTGKAFIVTAGASGIGLATFHILLSRRAFVAVCDINQRGLEDVISTLSQEDKSKVLWATVDVTDRNAVKTFFAEAKERFGRIDGIASIVGTGGHKLGFESIWETSPEEYDFILDVNLKGCFNVLSEGLWPEFLENPASVVHVGSMFSMRGFKKGAVFSASKHATIGMVKSAAMESAERGIRVNAVLPQVIPCVWISRSIITMNSGAIDTPMHQANLRSGMKAPTKDAPISRPGEAHEVASTICYLLGDESTFVTGAAWTVDGGANA